MNIVKSLNGIPCSQITDIATQIDNVYYASEQTSNNDTVYKTTIMLLLLGKSKECTLALVSEFARIYSLPTHEYKEWLYYATHT